LAGVDDAVPLDDPQAARRRAAPTAITVCDDRALSVTASS
jgi:hypothetical protein